ncbi:MAG: YgiT-type zinc finger domain-containing protein [Deltaproteobacteria bacterium]|nr:MAG: YgiT-type zinc finger domain-containing protein [Deltaproteobacteria bacterium]
MTSLPLKINDLPLVILKDLPAYQCESCREYMLDDSVLTHVEKIFDRINAETELEIVKYTT